jgi:hypothetical protein
MSGFITRKIVREDPVAIYGTPFGQPVTIDVVNTGNLRVWLGEADVTVGNGVPLEPADSYRVVMNAGDSLYAVRIPDRFVDGLDPIAWTAEVVAYRVAE